MNDQGVFLSIGLMLLFALLGIFLSKKFKQPVSVGIIILGILLGPSVLGVAKYDSTLSVIAQIGSMVLLFVAGLNSNIREVYTKRNFYVALWGALVPIVGGFIVARIFGYNIYTSIFVGAILTATCLGITSSVLKEIGKIKTETAKAMIGAAVIDDIISLTILSIVLGMSDGNIHPWIILGKILLVLAFVFAFLFFGEKVLTFIIDLFNEYVIKHSPKLTFLLTLSLVFLFSYLAQILGLAPIVGAFLVGISLSKSRAVNLLLAGSEYFELIFTSIFFISIGVVVELGAFYSLFWFIVALTLVAIVAKLIGAGFTARRMGFNTKDSIIVGVGMTPRGEVAFIIALNGLLLGVIDKNVYSAVVFMSFFTTIIALVALKLLYSKDANSSNDEEVDFIEMKIKR